MKTINSLISYLDSLEIHFDPHCGEYLLDDGNSTSERSFLSDSEAQDLVNEFREAVTALFEADNAIQFSQDGEVYSLDSLDFDLVAEEVTAANYDKLSKRWSGWTNYFDTIILKRSAYSRFCDFCDFCNNWGVFEDMFFITGEVETEIMGTSEDELVLVWNDHEGEFQILENNFLTMAAIKACGMN